MKSRKSLQKWKNKSLDSVESKASCKAAKMKKLRPAVTGDAKTHLEKQTYSSFVSGISDCSSCDQTKVTNFKSVEDCENVLQQFMNAFAQIVRSPRKSNDARQIGVQCLEYVNVILFNIQWLERERNQATHQQKELDKDIVQIQRQNIKLNDEISHMHQINDQLYRENQRVFCTLSQLQESLRVIQAQNNAYLSLVDDQKATVKAELQKLAEASTQVESDVVEKEVQWDNINYHLQKRILQMQRDHDQLKMNYELMCNALRVGSSGDVDNELVDMDVDVLEASYEAEMVMMKHAHESFISDLNKLNYKLWNEKFFARGRLEDEMKKSERYEDWLVALKQENVKYREEIFNLNKQVEDLLDVICSKLKNKCCSVKTK